MNNNEYGKTLFYRTDDGKKEMRVSDKESVADIIGKLKENAADPDAEQVDQIRIIDEENGGVTKKIIYADNNLHKYEKKQTASSKIFSFAVIAFIVVVALFLIFSSQS